MTVFRALLLGTAAAALAAGTASAQSVEWADDTVTFKLGPTYDDVEITAPREMLGSLFGPDERPFEGSEIAVTVNTGGVKGGISGPLHAFRPIWEELSGGTLNIVELPFGEHYTRMMLDLRSGTGDYDAFMVGAFWYGDIAPQGYAFPIDDFMESGDFPQWSYDVAPESLKALHHWGDTPYGVLNDSDGQVLYYRKSALEDEEHRAAFEEEYGYEMPVPPETWQQVLDIANYFNGKNWDDNDDQADSGMVLHLKVGEQGHYHFQSLSASFAITPGDEVTQYENVYWFDPTDMTPLINSPGHVRALEFLLDLHQTGPAAQVGWSLGEAWDYFLRGKSVFVYSWGDVGALCQDEARSNIRGDCAAAMLPASDVYYDHRAGEFVETDGPTPIGNTTGGSWHGVISAFSDEPEATYSLLALMAIEPVSKWNAAHGWTGVDPGLEFHFLEEQGGTATIEDYQEAGWHEDDVVPYTQAYRDTFFADNTLTYLRIPGTFEYWDILDKNLSATMAGDLTAQQALDDTAAAWEQVTDRLGRDAQIQNYQEAIGYEGG
jgi:multiple sugar transport system substrate-binding protein